MKRICKINNRPPFNFRFEGELSFINDQYFVIENKDLLKINKDKKSVKKKNNKKQIFYLNQSSNRLKTIIMAYLWTMRFVCYFGLQLTVLDSNYSSIFLNFSSLGAAELFGSFLSGPLKKNFSRVRTMQFSLLICALICYYTIYDPKTGYLVGISKFYVN